MTFELKNRYILLAAVAGLVVLLDQLTKSIILQNLPMYHHIVVVPGLFNITHIQNPGGAFGFLADQSEGLRNVVFLFVSSLALGLILYFYRKTPRDYPVLGAGFALIFGGALGNLIDRVRFGQVVDFLDFYFGRYHWPAFNIADSAITVGILIFVFHLLFNKVPE